MNSVEPQSPSTSPASTVHGAGAFREVLLEWFLAPAEEATLRRAGRFLEDLLRRADPLPEGEALRARVSAILGDLEFLAAFLQDNVDVRGRSTLNPSDWELAKKAGRDGMRLMLWAEEIFPKVRGGASVELDAATWEDAFGFRETALWPLAGSADAQALRDLGVLVYAYARESQGGEVQLPESSTRREVRAAARDLLYLSEFTAQTAALADGSLATALGTLVQRLEGVAQSFLRALCSPGGGVSVDDAEASPALVSVHGAES